MKNLTISYDTKEKGISGTFTISCPEMADFGLDPDNAQHRSLYWGWFRQLLVERRAKAKRLREGNKSTSPLSEAEVAMRMKSDKLPLFDEPSETQTDEQKASAALAKLTPTQIAELLAKAGITVVNGRG